MFNASNWLQRAKIASPEFIGSAECFISKIPLLGLEMFYAPCFEAIFGMYTSYAFVKTHSSDDQKIVVVMCALGVAQLRKTREVFRGGPFWK